MLARGPEVESWIGLPDGFDPVKDNDWSNLPFMALSDGAHAAEEDFSYFTLSLRGYRPSGDTTETGQEKAPLRAPTSLFGMSCTRQLDARELKDRPTDVTRSNVQKSIVLLTPRAPALSNWRDKLGLVTRAWFIQRDFRDMSILKQFQENLLASEQKHQEDNDDDDSFLGALDPGTISDVAEESGVSLRELVYDFKYQALVLFKCALLQPKMLFYGSRCERTCMVQFALISLVPGLIKHLEDCSEPDFDSYASQARPATSLRSSDRNSLLAYMGFPLQIFGKVLMPVFDLSCVESNICQGSLFGPYTPLQQLDVLADSGTRSYVVGSTNSLLLQQKDRYSDVIVNLDDTTITISSPSLRTALSLTAADRRWIDSIHQIVSASWDASSPSQPRDHGYLGSEEFIRLQFEEYLLALLSATKYRQYLYSTPNHKRDASLFPDIEGDPTTDFGESWLESWTATRNFELWSSLTDSHLFDIVEPRHPTAGGLSMDDVQRRFQQQIHDLHLDERFARSSEAFNKHLAHGQRKVSAAFSRVFSDIEARRNLHSAGNRRSLQQASDQGSTDAKPSLTPVDTAGVLPSPSQFDTVTPTKSSPATLSSPTEGSSPIFPTSALRARVPDLSAASATASAAGQRASAYISSWGSWANDRRRGWSNTSVPQTGSVSRSASQRSSASTASGLARAPSAGAIAAATKSMGFARTASPRTSSSTVDAPSSNPPPSTLAVSDEKHAPADTGANANANSSKPNAVASSHLHGDRAQSDESDSPALKSTVHRHDGSSDAADAEAPAKLNTKEPDTVEKDESHTQSATAPDKVAPDSNTAALTAEADEKA